MAKQRKEISKSDKWNVEALYPDLKSWEKDFSKIITKKKPPYWPEIASLQGKLGKSSAKLKEAIELIMSISRDLSKLYTYAHLRHDEDIADDTNKTNYNKILAVLNEFSQETAWFEPELLSLDDKTLERLIKSREIAPYKFYIERIIRIKKHTLAPQEEKLMAMAGKALQSPEKAFGAINNADFKFGTVLNSKKEEKELTHASYGLYLRDTDRTLRKNAFLKLQGKYLDYENTLCELINGEVQGHIFNAKARNYNSSLEAALFPKNIETEVYHSLVKAVNDRIDTLHRYVELRKKILGVDTLHLYDMYIPLVSSCDIKMPYKEAEEIVIESVAPLGAEYQNLLKKGLKDQRWVDRYENQNKRSGAYSSGCYDSMPYILMNYKEILRDVFTLAHEAGHSMHSLYTHTHQPYQYGDYPIFLAEVASTFNEELLMRLLLERASSKEERAFLINEKIEDIRGTLFRQTMFAEFELWLHETAENQIPLTPKLIKDQYNLLNKKYYGKSLTIDKEADAEWSRIPHFYYNFYVFQYATGISAALALAERVVGGGKKEREDYLSFLKAGSSRYPIDILKDAGVDMRSPKPVESAIQKFDGLVKLLEKECVPKKKK